MEGFTARGALTNKHVYCSRSKGPDPAGAAPGTGAPRTPRGRALPVPPGPVPRECCPQKEEPPLTRRLVTGHGCGHGHQWVGAERGSPELEWGPPRPTPPHRDLPLQSRVARGMAPGCLRGEGAGSVPQLFFLSRFLAPGSGTGWRLGAPGGAVPVPHGSEHAALPPKD